MKQNNKFKDLIYKDGELYIKIGWEGKEYNQCSYNNKTHQLHRLIYEYHHGEIPDGFIIDHINRNHFDNKIENLRLVTRQENQWNTKAKGYFWSKDHNKWRATIGKDYKKVHLGLFEKEEDAKDAYLKAKKQLHIIKEHNHEHKL